MKTKTLITGLMLGCASAVLLAAGTDAATAAAETDAASAFTDTLQAIVNFLPFPWNVVGGAVIAAGTAIFAWKKTKKKEEK